MTEQLPSRVTEPVQCDADRDGGVAAILADPTAALCRIDITPPTGLYRGWPAHDVRVYHGELPCCRQRRDCTMHRTCRTNARLPAAALAAGGGQGDKVAKGGKQADKGGANDLSSHYCGYKCEQFASWSSARKRFVHAAQCAIHDERTCVLSLS